MAIVTVIVHNSLKRKSKKMGDIIIESAYQSLNNPIEIEHVEEVIEDNDFNVMPHILMFGLPGLGKTTFIEVIHAELEKKYGKKINLIQRVAGQLSSARKVEELVKEIKYGDIVFIDEIASLRLSTEELLYSVLQDFTYYPQDDSVLIDDRSLVIEKNDMSKYDVPKCTICGATTAAGKITQPLRDRFPIVIELEKMSNSDLASVVSRRNAVKSERSFDNYVGQSRAKSIVMMHIDGLHIDCSNIKITDEASEIIGSRALGITRIANDFRFHAEARALQLGSTIVNEEHALHALDLLGVDENGTMPIDRRVIEFLVRRENKPVGVKSLASVAGCSQDDIENMVLPRLTSAGLITKDHRNWNVLTDFAMSEYAHIIYKV